MKHLYEENMKHKTIDPLSEKIVDQFANSNYIEEIEIDVIDKIKHVKSIFNVFEIENTCEFNLDEQNQIIDHNCNCSLCDDETICIHIAATLKKLEQINPYLTTFSYKNEDIQTIKKKREKLKQEITLKLVGKEVQGSRILLEEAKKEYYSRISMTLQDELYELIPSVEVDKYAESIQITYRVGNDKAYVVKHIEEFINRIDNHEEFRYGKNLSFIHKESAFDEFSLKQIQFLRKAIQNNKKYGRNDYAYYYQEPVVKRHLLLTADIIDDFYELYYDKDVDGWTTQDSDEKIHINVSENEYTYTYSLEKALPYEFGEKHLYVLNNTSPINITRYTLDNEGKALRFIKELFKKDMHVLKQENKTFYKYVISDIEDYLDINNVSQEDEIFSIIKLYGDIDDDNQVFVKLEYYNEDGKFQKGFNEQNMTTYTQDLVEEIVKKYAQTIDYDAHIAYFDTEGEGVYNFLYSGLPLLSEYCEIYVSDALKTLGKTQKYSITVGVKLENNLLEIDVDSIDIPKEELSSVLKAYRRKRKFFRLKNGQLLNLNSDDLEELNQFVEDYHISINDMKDKTIMPSYRMFSLEDDMENMDNLIFNRNEQFHNQIQNWKKKDISTYIPSEKYQNILRDYQIDGYQWLSLMNEYGFNGILADDMGLGKTLQVITLLESYNKDGVSIVVCPASLIYNWEDEVHKFSSGLKTVCICGSIADRKLKINEAHNYDLMITSYDYIRRDVELYENVEFNYVILDEAQNIKNQKTKNAQCVKKLKAKHKLALTGTPIENSLAELWSIFDFLMPNYLFNYHYFQSHYETDIVKNHDEEKQNKLKKLVSPFILRRNKKEVLSELPDKIEKNYLIDFNEEENKLYLANLAQVNEELHQMTKMESTDKIAILAMLTKLRQLCCEPRLLYENVEEPSSKLKACMELIHTLKENNQKVLLFSSFTSMLDLIAEQLYKEGISYYKLTGQTSKEDRRMLVDKFQNDDTTVFLISLKAGGTGLNLTAAEAVIHYDPWWNQSAQNQATDRAYRIGQEKNVQVFKLVMKNSIEEKIQKLQLMKKELADMFVENNEGSISRMSQDELLELFKM